MSGRASAPQYREAASEGVPGALPKRLDRGGDDRVFEVKWRLEREQCLDTPVVETDPDRRLRGYL